MIDTLVLVTAPSSPLPLELFQGSIVSEKFTDETATVRVYRNPVEGEGYTPRCTYWREGVKGVGDVEFLDNGLFKIELSLPKWARVPAGENPPFSILLEGVDRLNDWLIEAFGNYFPPVRDWIVHRLDVCYNFPVDDLPAYMQVLSNCRIGRYYRQPHDVTEGVVWKNRSRRPHRWIKFYNKTKEAGALINGKKVLRFEVSTYSSGVKDMAKRWFSSSRILSTFLHAGRLLYILAWAWDKLGLSTDPYGAQERLAFLMRDKFGDGAGAAFWHLHLIEKYGAESFRTLGLTSQSTYYRYRKALADAGLLQLGETIDGDTLSLSPLPPLILPVRSTLQELGYKAGDDLSQILGVAGRIPKALKLMLEYDHD